MKDLLITALVVWLVVIPVAVLVAVMAYPRYVKLRVSRAARRRDRYARAAGRAMSDHGAPIAVAPRSCSPGASSGGASTTPDDRPGKESRTSTSRLPETRGRPRARRPA